MKKAFTIFLALLMLTVFVSCGEPPAEEYTANPDAEVAVAYIYEGKAQIATRILTDAPLKSITLSCVYYDISGKQIGNSSIIRCEISGSDRLLLWQTDCPEQAVYIDSAIYEAEHADGSKSAAGGIEIWEKTVVEAFSIDTYLESMYTRVGQNAQQAEANPYVTLGETIWNGQEIAVNFNNIIEPAVCDVYLFALWFDGDGRPIKTNTCDFCDNGELMVANGVSSASSAFLFDAPESAQSVKLLVQSVSFQDGSTWENPYTYEWILYFRNN